MSTFLNFTRSRFAAYAAGACTALLLGVGVWILDGVETRRHQQEVRTATLQKLSTLRANAEGAVNKRLFLTLGLRAAVSSNPDITPREFADLAATLQQQTDGIRSLTLIKDNVITDVYPRAGNESAIGLKLLKHPAQRKAALRAIETRKPWLAGPVKLVQGGEAFIHRAPVFITPPGGEPASGRYWGMVSILIDKETLLREIERHNTSNFHIAIRGKDGAGANGAYFLGDESIEASQPMTARISLPTGGWQLLAVPAAGWPTKAPLSDALRLGGGVLAFLAGCLITMLINANNRLRAARISADAASRAKTEFLSNMSHEIRTPLTAILGFTDVLIDETDRLHASPTAKDAVITIQRSGAHLLELINDILDLARVEAGRLTLERRPVHPVGLLTETRDLFRDRAKARGNRLRIELRGEIPQTIETDATRLKQALCNLVGNAIKFTQDGIVRIVCEFDRDSRRLGYHVIDTGIGIAKEQLEHIFRPFEQADSSTSRQFGGSGLGLAITERIAELLEGSINVCSEPGQGSAFTFWLPVRERDIGPTVSTLEPKAENDTPPSEPTRIKSASGRVLVVEDEAVNRRLISYLLEKQGATVALAGNGREGVDAVLKGESSFDLIVMDMQMPVLDGYEATRELREAGYAGPILALTANAMSGSEDKCLAAGCDAFLTKPIDRESFLATVAQHLATPPATTASHA